jgi:2-keto-4-pentenoate hydratase/2-oxohepta-3-ene-1,7-dioic acid hydratase in catechol pathway
MRRLVRGSGDRAEDRSHALHHEDGRRPVIEPQQAVTGAIDPRVWVLIGEAVVLEHREQAMRRGASAADQQARLRQAHRAAVPQGRDQAQGVVHRGDRIRRACVDPSEAASAALIIATTLGRGRERRRDPCPASLPCRTRAAVGRAGRRVLAVPPAASKIIGVHLNYPSRGAERGRVPEFPSYFVKPPSSLAGDGRLVRPRDTELLGCEGEIAVIVGREARNVSPEEARSHIDWLAPANDVGVADFRWADRGSAVLSKGHDGFTPIGPAIPADSIELDKLVLRTLRNGDVVQEDAASNLIFDFAPPDRRPLPVHDPCSR